MDAAGGEGDVAGIGAGNIEDLKEDLEDLTNTISELRDKSTDLNNTLDELTDKIEDLEDLEDLEDIEDSIPALTDRIEDKLKCLCVLIMIVFGIIVGAVVLIMIIFGYIVGAAVFELQNASASHNYLLSLLSISVLSFFKEYQTK